jgi:hypothetical protein
VPNWVLIRWGIKKLETFRRFWSSEGVFSLKGSEHKKEFRVNNKIRRSLAARKRRIQKRLDKTRSCGECPVIAATNIQYEIADRTRAISAGGIGVIHQMAKRLGLDTHINQRLNVFKLYSPYSESDHVLNIAYNLLAGGTCLEHIELRRGDAGTRGGVCGTRVVRGGWRIVTV